jgi:hypothetical protein
VQLVIVSAAHVTFSVSRSQDCWQELGSSVQTLLRHLNCEQVQVWVPLSSQMSANEPQEPQAVTVSGWHSRSSGSREHSADSGYVVAVQVPRWHVLLVHSRVWVPLALQISSEVQSP